MLGERYILQLWDSTDLHEPIMEDSDKEYEKHKELFDRAKGDVLLIGLGIGFVNRILRKRSNIKSITVVEKELEIIEKVRLPDNERVIHADGLIYVPDKQYDTIWWDTWKVDYLEAERKIEQLKKYLTPGGWIGRFPI